MSAGPGAVSAMLSAGTGRREPRVQTCGLAARASLWDRLARALSRRAGSRVRRLSASSWAVRFSGRRPGGRRDRQTPVCRTVLPSRTFHHGTPECAMMSSPHLGHHAQDGDLTADIAVTVEPLCPAGGDGTCTSCSVPQLTTGGCLPGRYRLRYAVQDADGNAAELVLDAAVEEVRAAGFHPACCRMQCCR